MENPLFVIKPCHDIPAHGDLELELAPMNTGLDRLPCLGQGLLEDRLSSHHYLLAINSTNTPSPTAARISPVPVFEVAANCPRTIASLGVCTGPVYPLGCLMVTAPDEVR
jgi:hypothetical protein